MSKDDNTKLLEEARELADYWEGTLHAALIRNAIEANDLEVLSSHVRTARHEMLAREYRPDEVGDIY